MSATITITQAAPVLHLPVRTTRERIAAFVETLRVSPLLTDREKAHLAAWLQQFQKGSATPYFDVAELYTAIFTPAMLREEGLETYQDELLVLLTATLPPGWSVEECLATYAALNAEFEAGIAKIAKSCQTRYGNAVKTIAALDEKITKEGNALQAQAAHLVAEQQNTREPIRAQVVAITRRTNEANDRLKEQLKAAATLDEQVQEEKGERERLNAFAQGLL